jgi:hypothetical protein
MQSRCDQARPSLAPASPTRIAATSDVDRSDVAEQEDEDREPDGRLGRGDGQDEEHEHLPGHVAQEARERDEVDIDREQHQLDRHQHDEHVAPIEEYPRHADGEQDRAQHEIVRQRRHGNRKHSRTSLMGPATRPPARNRAPAASV